MIESPREDGGKVHVGEHRGLQPTLEAAKTQKLSLGAFFADLECPESGKSSNFPMLQDTHFVVLCYEATGN